MKFKGLIKNKVCNFTKNIPKNIEEKIGCNLYKISNHPLGIIKNHMIRFFEDDKIIKSKDCSKIKYSVFEDFHPKVTLEQNFFNLLVDKNHEVVSAKNTYYWDDHNVLRTHMTAHDFELLKAGQKAFISIGDVYRRDSIDATHYPVFHQIDGVRVYEGDNLSIDFTVQELKHLLEGLNKHLFGDVKFRWVDAYFPFTDPSFELEIFFNDKWLEVLGCGILRDSIINNAGLDSNKSKAWAFGIGIERLAMILFGIKDIRTFWSKDQRFLKQFKNEKIKKFKPYSKYPPCYKDISFYIDENFNENDIHEIIRNIAGDLVENVECVDTFNKNDKISKCFRILYRHMDRTFENDEINELQMKIRKEIKDSLKLELR